MGLPAEDFELLRQHLAKLPAAGPGKCPVCGANGWEAAGIVGTPVLSPERSLQLGTTIPTVMLVCSSCFYVQQFAWARIKASAEDKSGQR